MYNTFTVITKTVDELSFKVLNLKENIILPKEVWATQSSPGYTANKPWIGYSEMCFANLIGQIKIHFNS